MVYIQLMIYDDICPLYISYGISASQTQAERGEPQEPQRRHLGRAAALVDLHGATLGATHGEGGSLGSPVGVVDPRVGRWLGTINFML